MQPHLPAPTPDSGWEDRDFYNIVRGVRDKYQEWSATYVCSLLCEKEG